MFLNVYVAVWTMGVVSESETLGLPSRSPPCTLSVSLAHWCVAIHLCAVKLDSVEAKVFFLGLAAVSSCDMASSLTGEGRQIVCAMELILG